MSTWPQWTYLALLAYGVCRDCARDGQPRTGKHEAGFSLAAALILVWLFWMGGFFAPLGW